MTLPLATTDDAGTHPRLHPAAPPTPQADCTADHTGDITLTLPAASAAPGWDTLLLHRRGDDPDDTRRLPLTPAADGSRTATLPLALRLAEGRWDAYVTRSGTRRTRLHPGVNDLRTLADDAARARHTRGAVCVPYATKYGNLSLRTWLRWPHAEAGRVHLTEDTGTVEGLLLGADLTATARLEARTRGPGSQRITVPVTRDGNSFTAELPWRELTRRQPDDREHTEWELWLSPHPGGAEPIRLARILDDVPDKRSVYRYPPVRTGPGTTVGFAYTGAGDLSVEVRTAPG
ncbi:hypothetical protein [Streptomyces sp. JJ38]|uniref:hypothetical protein n=1 Tax=Streptomyces sp. JJ38 TaxID=2738128 RepID=UPI001C569911|nr:hypothetical protein [Streptomyces sp. JJ38]MBW1599457.1 hypothetical protein [Streptomyces sp. JJ38]